MGVTIRDKNGDGQWWVFITHGNRRTSLKVGNRRDALAIQKELRVLLALDRVFEKMQPEDKARRAIVLGDDLRSRLNHLVKKIDELMQKK